MKFSKASYIITLTTTVLIAITAWATMRTQRQQDRAENFDHNIVLAISTGDDVRLSAFFAEGIILYIPGKGSTGELGKAAENLKSFFQDHPVKDFTEEKIISGQQEGLIYLKGILCTQDKDYKLYATIYNGRIEQFDISSI